MPGNGPSPPGMNFSFRMEPSWSMPWTNIRFAGLQALGKRSRRTMTGALMKDEMPLHGATHYPWTGLCSHYSMGKPIRGAEELLYLQKRCGNEELEQAMCGVEEEEYAASSCSTCEMELADSDRLNHHLTTPWHQTNVKRREAGLDPMKRNIELKCSICDHIAADASSLEVHMVVHYDARPFKCLECDADFRWLHGLRGHMVVHTDERLYPCDAEEGCSATFNRASELRSHMRVHSDERPYICGEEGCSAAFKNKANLERYIVFHTELRPFECSTCKATFKQANGLKRHEATHLPPQHECEYCRQKYSNLGSLTRHRKRFPDGVCPKGMKRSYAEI